MDISLRGPAWSRPYIDKIRIWSNKCHEQSSSWERKSRSANLLWNLEVNYHVRKKPPPRSILILSFHLCQCLPSGDFSSGFSTKMFYAFLTSLIRPSCSNERDYKFSSHLIVLDLVSQITLNASRSSRNTKYRYRWNRLEVTLGSDISQVASTAL
jgi:hypothetical protein